MLEDRLTRSGPAAGLDAVVTDLVALTRIPAPTGAEAERVRWLERRLEGLPGRRIRDVTGNLVWRWGDGRPELLLLVHVDTVFPVATPLDVRRAGAWLHGPGVGDNAAAVAVAVHAVADRLTRGGPSRSGAVAFTVAEEGLGNLAGARAACADLRPRAAVALEGHGLDSLMLDAVGSVRATVRFFGQGGHSWADRGRPSAVHGLVDVGTRLVAAGTRDAPVNLARISGGGAINSIASEAELSVECRSVESARLDAFSALLADIGNDPANGLSVDVATVGTRPAGRLAADHSLAQAVRAIRSSLGLPEHLTAFSSDANAALEQGIPALCLGCARGEDMHAVTERIEVPTLALGWSQVRSLLDATIW